MDVIFLEPIFKNYIWGGRKLKEELNKNTPYDITAESWEISTNKNGISKIVNGEHKSMNLEELFQQKKFRKSIFGTKTIDMKKFPLLIKFIDAKENLSVQVHPDDNYAQKYENDSGKTEMWYILDCKENSKIVCGLKDVKNKEQLNNLIENGKIKEKFNYINVKKGDCIFVPSGIIHSILDGNLICEIQQNSDLTYRVYDWDRVDKFGKSRELHIDKAIDVIKLDNQVLKIESKNIFYQNLINSQYFNVDKYVINGSLNFHSSKETFFAINVIEGKGEICTNNYKYNIKKGDSFLIPAFLGEYKIEGSLTILQSYI